MENESFSKLRSLFWPIKRHELKSFVPIMILFFLVSFNYHILKILKDTLVITAKDSGAEVIPFLKVWTVLPSAILLTLLFTKLSSKFNRENIFYVMVSIFLIFFAFFIIFIYPNEHFFNLNSTADYLSTILPKGFKGLIAIVKYWHFSLFYIMAEAWSTIILSLLLWVFVVDVLSVSEAKRFYALFGVSRNIAGIFAGILGEHLATKALVSKTSANFFYKLFGFRTNWDQILFLFILLILVSGLLIIVIYRHLHKTVYTERHLMGGDATKNGRQKISLKKSILYAVKSKYVLYISLMVLSYNILINLTEVMWKSQIKELYPSSEAFTAYMSKITYIIGIIAALSAFFISGNIIRRLGWRFTAMVTPVVLLLSSVGFFYFIFARKYHLTSNLFLTLWGLSPLVLSVFFGSLQNVLSRALKYTVFDDTKEMAFIPLSAEEKLQGKSAIDGIGSRLGKSSSSLVLQCLFMIFSTPMGAAPIIFVTIRSLKSLKKHKLNQL